MTDDLVFRLSKTQDSFVFSESIVNLIYSSKGEGKCLDPAEKVIMYDGTLKQVKDIVVGDFLMGDDSTPRKVLELGSGESEMFEVVPIKGESFKCNGDHILVLNHPRRLWSEKNPYTKDESETEISVYDYMKSGKAFRGVYSRLFRAGIDFPEKEVPIDPYFLGIWLGDGDSNRAAITTEDVEILNIAKETADKYGLSLRKSTNSNPSNQSINYHLSSGNGRRFQNALHAELKALNLLNNKHIPDVYKFNSRKIRLKVLAGLVDTDGAVNHGGYDFVFVSEKLATDLVYLCRSLRLAAYIRPCKKTIKSLNFTGDYFRVHISGDCSEVPTLIKRKKCLPRKQVKRVWITGIKEIRPLGVGPYRGFVLDGNHRFLLSSFIVSHNTFSSIVALIYHAKRCGKAIRGAIVRDSHENMKISTVPSIMDALPLGYYTFKNDYKHLDIHSDPPVSMDLFGIDDLSSVSKLQGPEYAIIWLEEPAPIADAANAGLSEDVYNAALASCARQRGTVPRLQISMNPGNEDHWTYRRFFTDPILSSSGDHMIDPENPLITIKVFRVPVGENKELSDIARQATRSAYSNDAQSYARYAKGEFAKVYTGKKVTPDYNKNGQHFSDVLLAPANGLIGFRAWDSWHSPSCVVGQVTRTGRLIFLDTCRVLESDIRTLIKAQVQPLLNSPRWKDKCSAWRDVGDCSMRQPDQSNKNESAARAVEEAFGTIFEPGPKLWDHLKSGMTRALNESIKGLPAVVVNKNNRLLHDALSGSWHYKTDKAGNLINNIPHKTESCVDEKTEILTIDGWKKYDQIQINDDVYGYSMDKNILVPSKILAVNCYDYKKFKMMKFEHQTFDMVVTPNHKCVVNKRATVRIKGGFKEIISPFMLLEADKLNTGYRFLCVSPGSDFSNRMRNSKDREFSDSFIRLCAWVATEGCYHKESAIYITQSIDHNGKYIDEINNILKMYPCSMKQVKNINTFVPSKTRRIESAVWRISSELNYLIRHLMPNKCPSPSFISMMTQPQKRLFLYEVIKGDGDWGNDQLFLDKISRNRDFWTVKHTPRIADEKICTLDSFQHIATVLGIRSFLNQNGANAYQLSLARRSEIASIKNMEISEVYEPFVWCPTTTTGTWVARRNHKVFITGNSHVGDAFANACSVLLPEIGGKMDKAKWSALSKRVKNRAISY